jgi:hypothetical protein
MSPADNARIAAKLREIAKTVGELQHAAANLCSCMDYRHQARGQNGALRVHLVGYHLSGAREELETVARLLDPNANPAAAGFRGENE